MKKIIYTTLMVAVSITVFGQQAKPLKFGFELEGKFKKVDPNALLDSPTGVAYVGMFTEFYVANHFSGKLKVGLNNTYYHMYGGSSLEITGEVVDYPERSMYKQTLGVSLEPRFYLFSTKKLRKTNFYISLPVAFETAPAFNEKDLYGIRSELTFIPTLGIRYDFTKHFGIEASGGPGRVWYLPKYPLIKNEQKEFRMSAGLRYTF